MGFEKGHTPWNKGTHIKCNNVFDTLNKNNLPWNKGIACLEETKIKISEANKGNVAWNKGLKGWTSKGSFTIGHKLSEKSLLKMKETKKRKTIWNKERNLPSRLFTKTSFKKGHSYYPRKKERLSLEEREIRRKLHRKKYKALRKKGGVLTIKTIQLVFEDNIKRFGTLSCYLCLKPIVFGKDTLEHKIPLSRGGTNEYNNLAVACHSCNSKKHNKTSEEYINCLKLKKEKN